jgi:predicted dehydrogenase
MAIQKDDPSRRDIVKMAGTAGVAAAAASTLGAPWIQKVKAANSQVQYAMVGTGSRGSYLLKHLTKIDGGRCVAVCDIDDTALQRGAETIGTNPQKFKDYRQVLSLNNVDAVFVTTPLFAHFPVTKDALEAGKHVFCEKSMVFKPEEVHALRALAHDRPKQVLQVGLQRRYSKYYEAVRQMVEKKVLGDVKHIATQWHRNPGWTMKGDPVKDRMKNWRLFREYSGGLVAELASHQIDVADWMFGATPEFVMGLGGLDTMKDGRDIYDNVQLIFKYPGGKKLTFTSICTNSHLPLFGGTRTEMGELIMGTEGAVHITVGDDNKPCTAIWYPEPPKPKPAGEKKEAWKAGATMISVAGGKALPVLLERDLITGKESFAEKELKYARRWLYAKGVLVPEEDVNPVDTQLASFFECCRDGKRPKADVEIGLADSIAVILANLSMDQERRVYFSEIEKMGKPSEAKPVPATGKRKS